MGLHLLDSSLEKNTCSLMNSACIKQVLWLVRLRETRKKTHLTEKVCFWICKRPNSCVELQLLQRATVTYPELLVCSFPLPSPSLRSENAPRLAEKTHFIGPAMTTTAVASQDASRSLRKLLRGRWGKEGKVHTFCINQCFLQKLMLSVVVNNMSNNSTSLKSL